MCAVPYWLATRVFEYVTSTHVYRPVLCTVTKLSMGGLYCILYRQNVHMYRVKSKMMGMCDVQHHHTSCLYLYLNAKLHNLDVR